MRFFISRLSALGDVVCSLPAASALKASFPDCEIVWAVSEKFAPIVRCCRSVDQVIPIAKGRLPKISGPFDAALDLQGLLKSAILLRGLETKTKLGYHWQREGAALFSCRVLPDPTSLHVVDQYVDVARAAGGTADRAQFALAPSASAIEEMRQRLPETFIVVNPGAAWAIKRWPADKVASFIDLAAAENISVVLIGGKGETSAEEAAKLAGAEVVNLSGKTDLEQLIALISLSRAHVGGDTGSTHIAAALDVPAIGLYSATRPERSCPYGQIDRCIYRPEGLSQIEASDVFDKVMEAIA